MSLPEDRKPSQSSKATKQQRSLLDAELNRLSLMRYRRRNWIVGLSLLAGVLGIYGYSMYAVKQESLDLDELDEPVGQDSSTVPK